MANIKSAKKKVRKDKKRRVRNSNYMDKVDEIMRLHKVGKLTDKKISISQAYSIIDKASKKGVISSGRASRLKSRIANSK
jgi:ribosomal protein S20